MAKSQSNLGSNAAAIREVLKGEGFSDRAIRASLARMRQESGLNPLAINKNDAGKGKHSYGIFQWNRDRLAALQRFGGDNWQDVRVQAKFFAQEARGSEKRYGDRLLNAATDEEAAKAAISMARPQGWTAANPTAGHGWNNTINWTKNFGAGASGPATLYARNEKAGKLTTSSMLDGVSQQLSEPLPELPPEILDVKIEPVDNSPSAIAGQTALGFISNLSQSIAAVQDEIPEPKLSSQMKELSRAAPSPLTVSQIRSMIRV